MSSKNACNYQIYYDMLICKSFDCKRKINFHVKVEIPHKNAWGNQSFKKKSIQIWKREKKHSALWFREVSQVSLLHFWILFLRYTNKFMRDQCLDAWYQKFHNHVFIFKIDAYSAFICGCYLFFLISGLKENARIL